MGLGIQLNIFILLNPLQIFPSLALLFLMCLVTTSLTVVVWFICCCALLGAVALGPEFAAAAVTDPNRENAEFPLLLSRGCWAVKTFRTRRMSI